MDLVSLSFSEQNKKKIKMERYLSVHKKNGTNNLEIKLMHICFWGDMPTLNELLSYGTESLYYFIKSLKIDLLLEKNWQIKWVIRNTSIECSFLIVYFLECYKNLQNVNFTECASL